MRRPRRGSPAGDGDRLCYIYTARAGDLVWYGAADNRGHAALDSFAILPGYRGALVRDDYPAYARYDKDLAAVQLCCAHLLRARQGIAGLDADGENIQGCWANEVTAVLLDAKAAVDAARAAGSDRLDAGRLAGLRARYDQALAWGTGEPPPRLAQRTTSRRHPRPPPAGQGPR